MKIILPIALVVTLVACSSQPDDVEIAAYPGVTELQQMLQQGELNSHQLVDELLQRAKSHADLNAYITIDEDGARKRAKALDALRDKGESAGVLHGVPLVVKDNIHVAGLPNTAGTPGMKSYVPEASNAVVTALQDAGAIILGKTNMHELAFGITSVNTAFGPVRNPYDTALFAGGSSGGTASAISAGLAPGGLGTDTGGSARIPAALTGVVGFRPSSGRYNGERVTPISHTRDTVGLMAQTVADIALLDGVISDDSTTVSPLPATEIRLGVPRQFFFANIDKQSSVVIDAALRRFEEAGITLVPVDPEGLDTLLQRSAFAIALYEVLRDLPAYLEANDVGVELADIAVQTASPDVNGLFGFLATPEGQLPDEAYADALAARAEMDALFRDYFATNDLHAMVFPTTLLPSRPIEGSTETVKLNGEDVPTFATYIHNTDAASIAALPGISLPAGLTADGLPVGLEIDGPTQSDRQLLRVALTLESLLLFDRNRRRAAD